MKKRDRIRRRRDFGRALTGARVYSGPTLVAVAIASSADHSRVGITVSRAVRGAVRRNRLRRRLREVARRRLLADDSPLLVRGITYDVVLIGRPSAVDAGFEQLLADGDAFLRRLSSHDLGVPRR